MYIVFSYEISVYVFLIREYSTDRPLSEQQENAFLTWTHQFGFQGNALHNRS